MRIATVLAVALLGTTSLAGAEHAQAAIQHYQLNIPRQSLDTALKDLAQQTGLQIGRFSGRIDGSAMVGPVLGDQTPAQALKTLLNNTGLEYKIVSDTMIAVYNPKDATSTQFNSRLNGSEEAAGGEASSGSSDDANTSREAGKKTSQDFRLAQVDQNSVGTQAVNSQSGKKEEEGLAEIIVTAQKRNERIQDVPMSVTALSGDDLLRTQSYQLQDFVGKVPGVSLIDYGGAGSQVVIRGITTGSFPVNSSVATYIDETPFTAAGPFGQQNLLTPNVDTFDVQRVEVLKGPQGTLYGANSLGGVLKYVTNAPDPSGFAATVESGVSSVYNDHGGTGTDVHAMVNVPLADDLALRVVGYDNYYPGFTDDPSRGLTATNSSRFTGARAAILYAPTADFSVRFNALYQEKSWNDYPDEDVNAGTLSPTYGNLIQEKLINEPGRSEVQLYNVTINWDAGFAKLLSTSSYYSFRPHAVYEYPLLNAATSSLLGGNFGTAVVDNTPVQGLTQEVRLTSEGEGPLQWQGGAYFTNEDSNEFEGQFPINTTTKSILFNYPTLLGAFYIPVHFREYAGFADLDYHVTPTFDVSVGGRYSADDQLFHETALGLFGGGANFGNTSSEGVFTYSGDVRWHVTPENMLYARVAEGFAPGGPNEIFAGSSLPRVYGSSSTVNYEAGVKSSLLDNCLTIDVSIFDIDWRNIQLSATINGLSGIVNGGEARSSGVEWDFGYVPLRGLTLNFNGAYTDAHLTEATPASVGGEVGDRLPGAPLWGISTSADYKRPILGEYSGFVGIDWRFTGDRYSDFIVGSPRPIIPSFNVLDLRAGVETRRWSITVYAKNVANKIAINYVLPETSAGGNGLQDAALYPPRTVGATLTAKF
jgi:iron complex outermembrane receptor protein